jgi:hypothetical protein
MLACKHPVTRICLQIFAEHFKVKFSKVMLKQHITSIQNWKNIERFCINIDATKIVLLLKLNRKTINRYFTTSESLLAFAQFLKKSAFGDQRDWTPLEQINFEKVYPLCMELSANPCHKMLVGELGLPLSKRFNVKML